MKNIKKLGYISIELVIVAGVVLAFGLIGVMKFVKQGTQASKEQDAALNNVYTNLKEINDYNKVSNPTSGNVPAGGNPGGAGGAGGEGH